MGEGQDLWELVAMTGLIIIKSMALARAKIKTPRLFTEGKSRGGDLRRVSFPASDRF